MPRLRQRLLPAANAGCAPNHPLRRVAAQMPALQKGLLTQDGPRRPQSPPHRAQTQSRIFNRRHTTSLSSRSPLFALSFRVSCLFFCPLRPFRFDSFDHVVIITIRAAPHYKRHYRPGQKVANARLGSDFQVIRYLYVYI